MYCFECKHSFSGEDFLICNNCGKPLETDPDKFFKAGMAATARADIDLAIDLLDHCVAIDPDHASGRFNLGFALCMDNRCEEAMVHYVFLAENYPDYPGIYTALGQAALGNYLLHVDEAELNRRSMLELFKKAIEQDPDDVDAYFSLGNAHIAAGTPQEALPWLKQALNLHPESPAIYFSMAKAFKMLNKHSEAYVMAKRAYHLSCADDPFYDDIDSLFNELKQSA